MRSEPLTAVDRAQLQQFPPELTREEISAYFTLSAPDLKHIPVTTAPANRLGIALQLGALRYLGFFPDALDQVPSEIVQYVAHQLHCDPTLLAIYARREQTKTEHQLSIQSYLGFRKLTPETDKTLMAWLLDRALEHDRPTLLLQLLCDHLKNNKIIRPALTQLERRIARARELAKRDTFRRVTPLLTEPFKKKLESLLLPESTGHTPLHWLRRSAVRSTAQTITDALNKLAFLKPWKIDQWALQNINPNRLQFLARLGRRSTNQALARMPPERRYPILVAFLHHAQHDIIDEAIDLFDRCLTDTDAKARRALHEFQLSIAHSSNEKVIWFQHMARCVVDPKIPDAQLRHAIYKTIPPDSLRHAIVECDDIVRPEDDTHFDFLSGHFSRFRQFSPAFLKAFAFHSNHDESRLLNAVETLRQMNDDHLRKVPEGTSTAFVSDKWKSYVIDKDGTIQRRYFELCVLWELRAALRAGDLWIQNSRRYANPETYLIPTTQWPSLRPIFCELVQTPTQGIDRLKERQNQLETSLKRFDQALPTHENLRIEKDRLIVGHLEADDKPQSLKDLQAIIDDRLPLVDLPDLLLEVDGWTNFSRHLRHASDPLSRSPDLLVHCHAGILAQALNFGLTRMAQVADLSYDRLAWCSNWYLRDETLRPANATIVNKQYHHPLARIWGSGTLSSSDGQRFPASVHSQTTTALPRYYGYGQGLTYYTWTSDQLSQYGIKPTPTTVRDATFVLDEIYDNETELPIAEHTTDTAGYTDLIFGLFDLSGLRFCPRLRDLADQTLFRIDKTTRYQHIQPLVKSTLKTSLILDHWDDLLRVAASLKLGWVTASLFIAKLQSFRRQNILTRALQEHGRLIKTIFILNYLDDPALQRRIGGQLNKGESIHSLRRFLFFAHEGKIRRRFYEDHLQQANCLNLVSNAVILWNTVYIQAILNQLRKEGVTVRNEDVLHLSPARYEHINPYGKYSFNVDQAKRNGILRPLRNGSLGEDRCF